MTESITTTGAAEIGEAIEGVLIAGDLSKLNAKERVSYYNAVCKSLQLNPLTKPFDYLTLNGKLVLYANRGASEQLRRNGKVAITIVSREMIGDDVYAVTARAVDSTGRSDESIGAVPIGGLKGEAKANAIMKAECCPLDTEILTRSGFRTYADLSIGEDVLSYDCETDSTSWVPLEGISTFDDIPIVGMHTLEGRFSVRCTPDHKWAVQKPGYLPRGDGLRSRRGPYASRGPDRFLLPANEIKSSHRVILAAEATSGANQMSDRDAEILGWVATDGSVRFVGNSPRVVITQSKAEHVAEIRQLVGVCAIPSSVGEFVGQPTTRTFPGGKTYDCLPQHMFSFSADESRRLLSVWGIGKADWTLLPSVVTSLSSSAREAMLRSMMSGDGTEDGTFGKKRKPGVMESFQILSAMSGHALGKLGMSSVGDVPVQKILDSRYIAGSNVVLTPAGQEPVWCPTTRFGTWIARQDGRVFITGNTKAKRRVTLSICGLGMLDETEVDSIPSARRVEPDPPALPMPKRLTAAEQAADPFPELIPESEMAEPPEAKPPAAAPRQKKSLAEVAAEHAAQHGDKAKAAPVTKEIAAPERVAQPQVAPLRGELVQPEPRPFLQTKPIPEPESVPRPSAPSQESDFLVKEARVLKTGTRTTANGAKVNWVLHVIKTAEGVDFLTFSKDVFKTAEESIKSGVRVMFDFTVRQNKDGNGTSNEATAITLLG